MAQRKVPHPERERSEQSKDAPRRSKGEEARIRPCDSPPGLEPVVADWSWLDAVAGQLDDDFVAAVDEQPTAQERTGLDRLFR
jgi:antitoxin VapB